jgi:hypothetical protein
MAATEAGIWPEDASAGAINGFKIDRRAASGVTGGASAYLNVQCGAATGTPSAQTVDGKLQDSADGSSDWQDIGDAITTITTDDSAAESPGINLTNKREWIRAVVTVGFTDGSTPTIPVAASVTFGGRE